ncbi:MerR family transcriptional regulator [Sorangium sp. So ce136]|uniref:helix-turn-helix domain-containing protein n=1 Tax=Sorangium sp. So ce136 TaxID=3133284 RepID=UPI003F039448
MKAHRSGRAPSDRSPRARAAGASVGAGVTYDLAELAQASAVSPRTIRLYVARELLPPPMVRGTSTSYGQEHLLRLRAIARLRAEKGLRLVDIQRRLAKLSPAALADLAGPLPPEVATSPAAPAHRAGRARKPLPPPVGANARDPLPTPVGASARDPLPLPGASARDALPLPGGLERWERLALLPGLELHLRSDATAVVRRIAAEIHARYGALPPDAEPAGPASPRSS